MENHHFWWVNLPYNHSFMVKSHGFRFRFSQQNPNPWRHDRPPWPKSQAMKDEQKRCDEVFRWPVERFKKTTVMVSTNPPKRSKVCKILLKYGGKLNFSIYFRDIGISRNVWWPMFVGVHDSWGFFFDRLVQDNFFMSSFEGVMLNTLW
jgi:hypothetical protein